MRTVADYLAETLRNLGVTHVFGIIGKSICPAVLKMVDYGLEFIPGRHESSSGFSASGYALQTGKLGVAFATSGPGGTNLLTAAAHAKANNLPVLFITGHQSIQELGLPQCQDSSSYLADLAEMFRPATLFSKLVERGDHFGTLLNHALSIALGPNKGPVHLCIPFDVQTELLSQCRIVIPEPEPLLSVSNLNRIFPLIQQSNRPLIIAGKGVSRARAHDELLQLAESFNIPVITTPGGKGAIAWDHPLYHGPCGVGGFPHADDMLNQSDLYIVLGSRLSDMTLCNLKPEHHPAHLIQFDADPTFVGKILSAQTLHITGDLKDNLQYLLGTLEDLPTPVRTTAPIDYTVPLPDLPQLSLASVLDGMSNLLPYDHKLFVDDGSHGFHAVQRYKVKKPGSFVFDAYFACMGNAIGMAIGAKAASPEETVVCITGDGCFMMLGTEINTAVCNNLNVIFIVVNNKQLDMALKGMEKTTGRIDGTLYEVPMDAAKFAESLGAVAFRAETLAEFSSALNTAQTLNQVTVIELLTDRDEIPPTAHRTVNLN
ncbi:thiamine pyrophosphate-binding protein [Paenibacillus xylanexedens]|uniref:Acetolactate synthase-1/2/3 large subunit n=1 Tax=Paenibacillus xylanexedens TaxID=528191 RepID=A0ABS4RM34_PAEXY|nr:thiamine pyrophosphate-binding protein [Paenibacillus xylanexedens]MBP2243942.1 acetolactate synthase-1/2/3 large subunit [Paenibacillus xylanexedens]